MKKPRLLSLVAVGVVALATITGCTPSTASTAPTPSGSPTPATSAPPTPSASASPSALVVTTAALTLTAADGTALETFGYFDDTAQVVDALSDAFGFEPEVRPVPNPGEGYSFTSHDWAGFELRDYDQPMDGVLIPNYILQVRVPEVSGIAVRTGDGVSVGGDTAVLEESGNDTLRYYTSADGVASFIVGVDPLPKGEYVNGDTTVQVTFTLEVVGAAGGSVVAFFGPSGGKDSY